MSYMRTGEIKFEIFRKRVAHWHCGAERGCKIESVASTICLPHYHGNYSETVVALLPDSFKFVLKMLLCFLHQFD